jgi:uncharacterized protein (TIGR00255 family)
MIRSMTGFGAGRASSGGEEITVELRSVNQKFCEVKARLPRELAALEPGLVRQVKDRLARGGIDLSLRRTGPGGSMAPRVDGPLAEAYARAYAEVQVRLGLHDPIRLADIVAAEGVIRLDERDTDLDAARGAAEKALGVALEALLAMREREGEALGADLEARLATVLSLVAQVEVLAPQAVEHHRTRLAERVRELTQGMPIDPGRLAQEVALLADRSDVAEEITRLRSHVAQARQLLAGQEPAGRKLDFLVQEMHREVNTIGSKSQHAELSGLVVSLKAEVERMREQVQNVE